MSAHEGWPEHYAHEVERRRIAEAKLARIDALCNDADATLYRDGEPGIYLDELRKILDDTGA